MNLNVPKKKRNLEIVTAVFSPKYNPENVKSRPNYNRVILKRFSPDFSFCHGMEKVKKKRKDVEK